MSKVKTLLVLVSFVVIVYGSAQVRQEKVGNVDVLIKTTEGCVDNCRQETPVVVPSQIEIQVRRSKKRARHSAVEGMDPHQGEIGRNQRN